MIDPQSIEAMEKKDKEEARDNPVRRFLTNADWGEYHLQEKLEKYADNIAMAFFTSLIIFWGIVSIALIIR